MFASASVPAPHLNVMDGGAEEPSVRANFRVFMNPEDCVGVTNLAVYCGSLWTEGCVAKVLWVI